MTAVLLLPGVLRGDADGQSHLPVDVAGGATLGELLDRVRDTYPRLERRIRDEQGQLRRYVNVFVDGDECRTIDGLSTSVRDGAEIQVLASIAGG